MKKFKKFLRVPIAQKIYNEFPIFPKHYHKIPTCRDVLQQNLLARKGGVIGTSGRGALSLRFDDAPVAFRKKVLPLLIERNLPFTRVNTSDSLGGNLIAETEFTLIQKYCLAYGGEVWNHGRDHKDATLDNLEDNIVGSLHRLRKLLPLLPIDCFAPPGGSSIKYAGHMPSRSVDNWNTPAGQLILQHHALASGYLTNSYYRPLDGILRDGQVHYSCDTYNFEKATLLVDRAAAWKTGVVMMWHSNNFDLSDKMSLEEFELLLDYIVEKRDTEQLLVLTTSGLAVADINSHQRDNILQTSFGNPFIETVEYPQYRQSIPGSTRELICKVNGNPGDKIVSSVGNSRRSHTIPESGILDLRHISTIPLNTKNFVVKVEGDCYDARLLAI